MKLLSLALVALASTAGAATTITAAPDGGVVVTTVPAPQVRDCADLRPLVDQVLPGATLTAWTPQYAAPSGRATLRCVALAHGRQYRITYTTNAARTVAQVRVEPGGAGR